MAVLNHRMQLQFSRDRQIDAAQLLQLLKNGGKQNNFDSIYPAVVLVHWSLSFKLYFNTK